MVDLAPDILLKSWYLVQIKPNGLAMARRNLESQNFTVFSPTQVESIKKRGKFASVSRPLFPGYIFVGCGEDSAPWQSINSTYGVSRMITFGDAPPQPMPSNIVEGLMLRCDSSGQLLPPESLKSGDKVRLVSGPFADFVTNVEKISKDQRVWVLLDIMGGATKVAVTMDQLQKL